MTFYYIAHYQIVTTNYQVLPLTVICFVFSQPKNKITESDKL